MGTRDVGAVTAAVRYYSEPELLFNVSRGSFMPAPNVDSAVIRIDVDKERRLAPDVEKFFFKIVKAGFSQRRKTLANSLSSMLGFAKNDVYTALSELGISESVRIEALTMEQLTDLSKRLMKTIN